MTVDRDLVKNNDRFETDVLKVKDVVFIEYKNKIHVQAKSLDSIELEDLSILTDLSQIQSVKYGKVCWIQLFKNELLITTSTNILLCEIKYICSSIFSIIKEHISLTGIELLIHLKNVSAKEE